jgi:hypothetical protein
MSRHANAGRDRIAEAEFDRIQAAAKAAGCGPVFICRAPAFRDPAPSLTARIAGVLFPWLAGPEAEREAEL